MTPLLYADRSLSMPENFGVLYYQSGLAFQNRTGRLDQRALLNGAFLFLKTEICRQLMKQDGAVFRPEFFLNAEDIELSLRLLSRAYTIRVNPNLRARHLGSQSVQRIAMTNFRLAWRNLLWTLLITRSNRELMVDAPCIVAGQFVQVGLSVLRARPDLLVSVLTETWRHRRDLLESRRRFKRLKQHAFRDFVNPGVFPLGRRR
jgi:GT2 family glycosyltransferase